MQHNILNATLSKVTIYFIVTKKDWCFREKEKREQPISQNPLKTQTYLPICTKYLPSYSSIPNNWHIVGT